MIRLALRKDPLQTGIPGHFLYPEGSESEWKVRLPSEDRIGPLLVAFANGVGGVLQVGVSDDGRCVGVTKHAQVLSLLRRIAVTRIRPALELSFEVFPLNRDGRSVVACLVPLSEHRPVVFRTRDGESRVYVRDGDSTRRASPEEVRRLQKLGRTHVRLGRLEREVLILLAAKFRRGSAELLASFPFGKARLGRILARLLQSGWIFRGSDARWSLSPKGAALVKRIWKKSGRRTRALLLPLDETEGRSRAASEDLRTRFG